MAGTYRRLATGSAVLILVTAAMLASASAQGSKTYKHLAIRMFDLPENSGFPADFAEALRQHLVHQLEKPGGSIA